MKKTNIVLITCHDIGQHLGCYGVKTVSTPSIDSFASEAVRFKNSFCTSPQCSPSRASIYTGRYPHNNGVMGLTHYNFAWDLNSDERHLAVLLKNAGYQTSLIGIQHETRYPEKIGFDNFNSIEHPVCERVAEDCVDYICKHKLDNQPFYLQVGFFEPHRKFDFGGAVADTENGVYVPSYLVDDEAAKNEFAEFQGAIRKVDGAVGKIFNAIKENGLYDNTIVIYTADHGIPFPRAKCSLYDAGIEVPFIIRCPEKGHQAGKVYEQMISNIDYLPTILDLIGLPIPTNVQGLSFASLLNGSEYKEREEIFAELTYHDYYNPMRCIRTKKYKLIANFSTSPSIMNPSQAYHAATITKQPADPAYSYKDYIELYDIETDRDEFCNICEMPEVDEIKKELCGRLLKWMTQTNDPLLNGAVPSPHHFKTFDVLQG